MMKAGGTIALVAGIAGIFTPFIESLWMVAFNPDGPSSTLFTLVIGLIVAAVVIYLSISILSKRDVVHAVVLVVLSVLAMLSPFGGGLTNVVLLGALAGGVLAVLGSRSSSQPTRT